MYDVIIIGGGPAGMTAALYLKRSGLNPLIVESKVPGGQIIDTNSIENYPGFTKISGSDLSLNILKQLKELEIPLVYEEVISVEKEDLFNIQTNKNLYQSKKIIIATGKHPRILKVENEEKFRNKGISYCAICDGSLYKNKKVVVLGAGDSAFTAVNYLSLIAKEVILISRSSKYRASQSLITKVKALDNVKYMTGSIASFEGSDVLEKVRLSTGEEIECSAAFIYIGHKPSTGFVKNIDILENNGYVKVNEKFETEIKGLYAIGDCVKKDHYQIITAMADAVNCALYLKEDFHE